MVKGWFSGGMEIGIYEISEVGDDYFKCVDLDWVGGPTNASVEITIGGAFETIREVLSEVDASNHGVTIYANHIDPDDSTIVFDAGGDITKNSFLRLTGFRLAPGDMNYGGDYYESPIEILQNDAVDNTKTVMLYMGNP